MDNLQFPIDTLIFGMCEETGAAWGKPTSIRGEHGKHHTESAEAVH